MNYNQPLKSLRYVLDYTKHIKVNKKYLQQISQVPLNRIEM